MAAASTTVFQRVSRYLNRLDQLQKGLPDPRPMVAEWVDGFLERIFLSDTDDPEEAFDIVVSWGRLARANRKLVADVLGRRKAVTLALDQPNWTVQLGERALRKYEERFHRRLPELVGLALEEADLSFWLTDLEGLASRQEEFLDPEDAFEGAITLFMYLDDVELIGWAAEYCQHPGAGTLARRLNVGRAACAKHAAVFTWAEEWIEGFAQAVDPDPPHPGLHKTLQKLVPLLRAMIERRYPFAHDPVVAEARWVSRQAVRIHVHKTVSAQLAAIVEHLQQTLQPPALAASAQHPLQTLDTSALRWVSPDTTRMALIEPPFKKSKAPRPGKLTVAVKRVLRYEEDFVPGAAAIELLGTKARLCGVEATGEQGGLFHFDLDALATALEKPHGVLFEVKAGAYWEPWYPAIMRIGWA